MRKNDLDRPAKKAAPMNDGLNAVPLTKRQHTLTDGPSWLEVLRPIWLNMLLVMALLWLSRLALGLWQWDRIAQSGEALHLVMEALRFDGVLLGIAWTFPACLTPWMSLHPRSAAMWRRFLWAYGGAIFMFVAFMEMCTPSFINQYDARPNFLFVEYLKHGQEVGATLLAEYPLQLLLTALAIPILGWFYVRLASQQIRPKAHHGTVTKAAPKMIWRWASVLLLSALLLTALALMGRGTLGHRAANPTLAAISSDHWVNEWPLASAYTMLYAVYQNQVNEDGGVTYGQMSPQRVVQLVRQEMGLNDAAFTDPNKPTWRQHPSGGSLAHHVKTGTRAPNLVIVLEESLGAEFVGQLGGLPLTPNLDKLSQEGIWFNQMYATGTRSVRGIEAVVAGFPPTSTQAVVKQNKAQRNFVTMASLLRAQQYQTTFFYGGESHFDNMRGFFLGNGFERVVDQKDLNDARFVGTWGASDGDVFDAAHRRFSQANPGQPFFSLIFTSSNHSPFEFPDNTIDLYEQPKGTVNNAVKYADHALGQFIAQAKKSPYWANTLFLIVADHNSRVYGNNHFPVDRFHIPALILGGPVQKPRTVSTLSSQLDLMPTLIALMGLETSSPLIGRDLLQNGPQRPGRAIMQFDQLQAYREENQMVILQPGGEPKTLGLTGQKWALTPPNPVLIEKAIAHALYAKWAYAKGWHSH
jgi:phosphoglycerol transferase MdoB-like AlkP superfamily enzyme